MPRRAEGRITGQPVTHEIPQPAGGVKLVTFIPWTLVKRGMKKEIITPIDAPEAFTVEAAEERQRKKAEQHAPVVRALGLAYYWQSLIESGKFDSISAIADAEGLSKGHVNRLMQLSRLSPERVRHCLEARRPPSLESLTRQGVSLDWNDLTLPQ
jgi:hypothetical protein